MAVRPLGDRVAVEVLENTETVVGGVILPGASTDDLSKATVVAVGTGGFSFQGERVPLDVGVGDTVLFPTYRGTLFRDSDGTSLKILEEKDILAIVS